MSIMTPESTICSKLDSSPCPYKLKLIKRMKDTHIFDIKVHILNIPF